MNEREPLDTWIESQRAGGAPDGFADRVMRRVHVEAAAGGCTEWWDRPLLQGTAWAAAILVAVTRTAAALAVFWV